MMANKDNEMVMWDSKIVQCDPDKVTFDTKVDIFVLDDGSKGTPPMIEIRRTTTITPIK